MAVFQTIRFNCITPVLALAISGLLPGGAVLAQPSDAEPLPAPQDRPTVESYSLPPGPRSNPEKNVIQGPVDAGISLPEPVIVPPRAVPAKVPGRAPDTANPTNEPAPIDSKATRSQPPVRQALPEDEPATSERVTEAPPLEMATPATEDPGEISAPEADNAADGNPEPPARALQPETANAISDGLLWLLAALAFGLLGGVYFWRSRRASSGRPVPAKPPKRETDSVSDSIAPPRPPLPQPPLPVPTLTIGFRANSASATLINAVLGFELTLSNHGKETLQDIRIHADMVQADENGRHGSLSADLNPLKDIGAIGTGETETVTAELRIPLAGIRPIIFRSQALFVPLVQVSIEFRDSAGNKYIQTGAYLVGQEHQPPRPRMAPFRLDLGPRRFTPIGHRPLATA